MDWRRLVDGALEASVVGSFTTVGSRVRRSVDRWSDPAPGALVGRSVMVTGASSGLGLVTARACARLGATVHLVGRDPERLDRARTELTADADGDVRAWIADLADLGAVRSLAERFAADGGPLDTLVHNAGALLADRTVTAQGHETTYAAMVLGPALLTELLLDRIEASAAAVDPPVGRVIWVSSGGMYAQALDVDDPESVDRYRGTQAYAKAKRAQVVLTEEWGRRLAARSVVVHAMHPGWAATPGVHASLPTFERVMGPLLRSPEEGADTVVWLCTDPEPARSTGRFWHDRRARSPYRLPGTRETTEDRARLLAAVDGAVAPFR